MKFRVYKTSTHHEQREKRPCDEAVAERRMMTSSQFTFMDRQAKDWKGPLPEEFLKRPGTNHRIEGNFWKIDEREEEIFTIEISSWSEFLEFGRKCDYPLVVNTEPDFYSEESGLPTIEIYDDHRE